ncbi:DNA replication and repair protein RadC [Balnearium lithotrophicum]|uniref:DNA replication and repair protein RadC n=1 Tax=Balnearium lithotrophicum TaxID=223788 RepID=A0A521BJ79_9BACT|nr:DNA replication and repair protein RadC [Balnearium lithotrophicum]
MYSIKELPESDRPREKLERLGAENLSDSELLAIILRTGTFGKNALDLSRELIKEFGGLSNLSEASLSELMRIKGLGRAKAVTLSALFELCRRIRSQKFDRKISSPEDAFILLNPVFSERKTEHFGIVTLNRKGAVINIHTVSVGGSGKVAVEPKEVFRPAIKDLAEAVILFHNHPSGDPKPSREDIEVTKKLLEVGNLIGIEVLDHIILGRERFFSFKGEGLV